jgi:hypothetical protein
VRAILDRQSDEQKIVEDVGARADDLARRIALGARALIVRASSGSVSPSVARAAFVALFRALHLVELARAAPDVLELLDVAVTEELEAFKSAGSGVAPIQAAERVARELERRSDALKKP